MSVDAYHSEDYAGMNGGQWSFYYGYEKTNDAGDWLFVAYRGQEEFFSATASELHQRDLWDVTAVLLYGIAFTLEKWEKTKAPVDTKSHGA